MSFRPQQKQQPGHIFSLKFKIRRLNESLCYLIAGTSCTKMFCCSYKSFPHTYRLEFSHGAFFSQFPQRPIYRHRYWIDLWSLPYKLKLIAAFVLVPNHLLLLCSFGGKIKKKDERSVILFLYQAASEVILLSPTSVSLFVCRAGGGVTCLIYIFTEDIVWCSVSCSDSKSTGTFWSNKNSS